MAYRPKKMYLFEKYENDMNRGINYRKFLIWNNKIIQSGMKEIF